MGAIVFISVAAMKMQRQLSMETQGISDHKFKYPQAVWPVEGFIHETLPFQMDFCLGAITDPLLFLPSQGA